MSDQHPTMESVAANFMARGIARRSLLTKGAIAGAAAVGVGLLGPAAPKAEAALSLAFGPKGARFSINDEDILNFALNLEYLEAEYYQRSVNGKGLADINPALVTPGGTKLTGTTGQVSGPVVPTNFATAFVKEYAAEIAADELNHVEFLRSALGKFAVAEPSIDVSAAAFAAAATAAMIPNGASFSPYADGDVPFLLGAYIFEDVGVTAYHGAAPYVRNPAYLSAAAGILAVEAYHASEVRLQIVQAGAPYTTYANLISSLRNSASAAADGVATTDEGVTTPDGTPNLVPTDVNSIAFARSFGAVLNIVYLGTVATTGKGGFFPNGLNGRITSLVPGSKVVR